MNLVVLSQMKTFPFNWEGVYERARQRARDKFKNYVGLA